MLCNILDAEIEASYFSINREGIVSSNQIPEEPRISVCNLEKS